MRVYTISLRTRFRGLTVREGALLEGAAGWGEWSPFWEYDARTAEPWLRFRMETAYGRERSTPTGADLVTWLRWLRSWPRARG